MGRKKKSQEEDMVDKAEKEKAILYCICQQEYDEIRAMICCDGCDEWFHAECFGLEEEEVDDYDKFYCNGCLGKNRFLTSVRKDQEYKTCFNSWCNEIIGECSKYCSINCAVLRSMILADNVIKYKRGNPDILTSNNLSKDYEELEKLKSAAEECQLNLIEIETQIEFITNYYDQLCHDNPAVSEKTLVTHQIHDCLFCGIPTNSIQRRTHFFKCLRKNQELQVETSMYDDLIYEELQHLFCDHINRRTKTKCGYLKRSCPLHNLVSKRGQTLICGYKESLARQYHKCIEVGVSKLTPMPSVRDLTKPVPDKKSTPRIPLEKCEESPLVFVDEKKTPGIPLEKCEESPPIFVDEKSTPGVPHEKCEESPPVLDEKSTPGVPHQKCEESPPAFVDEKSTTGVLHEKCEESPQAFIGERSTTGAPNEKCEEFPPALVDEKSTPREKCGESLQESVEEVAVKRSPETFIENSSHMLDISPEPAAKRSKKTLTGESQCEDLAVSEEYCNLLEKECLKHSAWYTLHRSLLDKSSFLLEVRIRRIRHLIEATKITIGRKLNPCRKYFHRTVEGNDEGTEMTPDVERVDEDNIVVDVIS